MGIYGREAAEEDSDSDGTDKADAEQIAADSRDCRRRKLTADSRGCRRRKLTADSRGCRRRKLTADSRGCRRRGSSLQTEQIAASGNRTIE